MGQLNDDQLSTVLEEEISLSLAPAIETEEVKELRFAAGVFASTIVRVLPKSSARVNAMTKVVETYELALRELKRWQMLESRAKQKE